MAQPDPRRGARCLTLAAALTLALPTALATVCPVAHAEDEAAGTDVQRAFDIPPGPLGSALNRFADRAGLALTFDPGLLSGLRTDGLAGEYTVRAGLRRLLAGSGLDYRFSDANTVTVVAGESGQLDRIRVEGVGETATGPVEGYRARRSATATRTDTAIEDTPASVQVVPRDVIEDQQALELREVLQNVSGVNSAEGSTLIEARETVITRGFSSRAVYYDGFRAGSLPTLDLVNVERVGVLKGPASIVAGQIEPGGLVNLVPKRPGYETGGQVGVRVGEFDFKRLMADATAVSADGRFGARMNASATDRGSFRDFVDVDSDTVAPSFRIDLEDRGRLEMGLLRQSSKRPFDEGVSFAADGEAADDITTYLGGPDLAGSDFHFSGLRLAGDLDVTEGVTLRGGVFHQEFDHDFEAFRPLGDPGEDPLSQGEIGALVGLTPAQTAVLVPADPVADDEIFRFYDNTQLDVETTEVRLEVLNAFSTGGWEHQVLTGVNLRQLDRDLDETRGFDLVDDPALVPTGNAEVLPQKINIEDPQHGDAVPTQNVADGSLEGSQDEIGFYVQDSLVGGDRQQWHLLAGLRHDEVEQEAVSDRAQNKLAGAGQVDRSEKTDRETTGRLGALYRIDERWSPYASYSESFSPSGTKVSGSTGELLDATTGEQLELGVKFDLFSGALSGTASVYRIDRDGVPIQDPTDPTLFVNGGEQRSEGFELDLAGRPAANVDVLASIGYVDARWEESTQVDEGTPLRGVPQYSASLTSAWRIDSGPLSGYRLSGTLFSADDRPGDDQDSFELDGFTTLSVGLAREWQYGDRALRARLLVKNLTDEEYFVASNAKSSVVPGAPRTVFAGLDWRF